MSNILSEEFVAALQSKILLKDLLSNDSFEKQFNSLTINADKDTVDKNDFEKVSDYLIQPEVLADMIDIMV